jgi:hypothetical protein
LNDFPLTEVRGEIALTPAEIKAEKVRALLSLASADSVGA